MDHQKGKGRNPELLTDRNGHAVQCFPLGGDTIEVAPASTFKPKSALIRVVNKSSSDMAFIKREQLEAGDPGTPLSPYQTEMFYVIPGEIYTVTGANVYVTFIRDHDV